MQSDRIIREPECRRVTGLARNTRWRMMRRGEFPQSRQIAPGAIGWLESEVLAWIAGREKQKPGAMRPGMRSGVAA